LDGANHDAHEGGLLAPSTDLGWDHVLGHGILLFAQWVLGVASGATLGHVHILLVLR
jgi:hypothetical protein